MEIALLSIAIAWFLFLKTAPHLVRLSILDKASCECGANKSLILRKSQHITVHVQNGKFGGTVEGGFDGLDDFDQVFDAVVESAEPLHLDVEQ